MAHAGSGAYGYGQVYRQYPQAQAQQVPPRLLQPVTDAAIRYVPPWEVEAAHWAAEGATVPVVFLVDPEVQPGGKFPPIPYPFPRLEQWWPHRYDPPAADAIFAQFELPRLPPPPPAPLIPPWWAEVEDWAALNAILPVVYLVLPRALQIGAPPVGFPLLGQWQPTTQPLDEAYYSFRLRLIKVSDPVFIPPPWAEELDNWASLNASSEAIYLERLDQVAIPILPTLIMPWEAERQGWAAIGATTPALYLVRSVGRSVEAAPYVPAWAAPLAHLAALDWRDAVLYLARLEVQPAPPPLGLAAWERPGVLWAALGAVIPASYLVRPALIQGVEAAPYIPAWAAGLAHLAALDWRDAVLYLARLEIQPGGKALAIPPAPFNLRGAYAHLDDTIVFAQPPRPPLPAPERIFLPPAPLPWLVYLAPDQTPYFFRLPLVVEVPPIVGPWVNALRHWPALGRREPPFLLERPPLIFVPGLPPPVPTFEPLPAVLKRFSSGGWGRLRGR